MCENKLASDHLLFIRTSKSDFYDEIDEKLIFDTNGNKVDESLTIGERSGAFESCSVVLNGEPIIFGGDSLGDPDISRQVKTFGKEHHVKVCNHF